MRHELGDIQYRTDYTNGKQAGEYVCKRCGKRVTQDYIRSCGIEAFHSLFPCTKVETVRS